MAATDLAALTEALRRRPKDSARWLALGRGLRAHGRLDEAAKVLLQAVRLAPSSAEASLQLGLTLDALGELPGAATCLERVCTLEPKSGEAARRLAFVLVKLGRPAEAVAHYQRALRLAPRAVDVAFELSAVHRALGDLRSAAAQCRQALELSPDAHDLRLELANLLYAQGEIDDALSEYEAVVARKPDFATAHANLGNAQKDVGQQVEASASHRRAVALAPDDAELNATLLFALSFDPTRDASSLLSEAQRFGERHTRPLALERPRHERDARPERKLRIGYVSSEFREHVCRFYLEPLLRHHDREAFEITCYSNVFPGDAWTARYRQLAARFREIWSLEDRAVAALIQKDEIDILVDLTLHSGRPRPLLFARKPAPIQVGWLGYVGTTGNDAMDYRISDPHLDPPDAELPYTERTWRLPHSFWAFDPLTELAPTSSPPRGDPEGITFGCLASFCKVNALTLGLWAAVLDAVPGSRLVMHAPPGRARARAATLLEQKGVARARVEFLPHQPRAEYLRSYARIDVCLDTLPYNGLSNTIDAALCGVPTITLRGETAVGRAATSVLMNLGLPDLSAGSPAELVQIAVGLARDRPRLAALRGSMRERFERSPLSDTAGFARELETAYRGMWRAWCGGGG